MQFTDNTKRTTLALLQSVLTSEYLVQPHPVDDSLLTNSIILFCLSVTTSVVFCLNTIWTTLKSSLKRFIVCDLLESDCRFSVTVTLPWYLLPETHWEYLKNLLRLSHGNLLLVPPKTRYRLSESSYKLSKVACALQKKENNLERKQKFPLQIILYYWADATVLSREASYI